MNTKNTSNIFTVNNIFSSNSISSKINIVVDGKTKQLTIQEAKKLREELDKSINSAVIEESLCKVIVDNFKSGDELETKKLMELCVLLSRELNKNE